MSIVEDMPKDIYLGKEVEDIVYADTCIDSDDERRLAAYDGKNEYMRKICIFREVDTDVFLRILFCRGDDMK